MYCPKCGSEESGQFCKKCGARLQKSKKMAENLPITENQESAEEQGIQREKRRKKMLIYTGAALIAILVILIVLSFAGKAIRSSYAKKESSLREEEAVRTEAAEEGAETEAKANMTDEENGRYYYASASRFAAQEITKTEYEEFAGKYSLLTGVKWNKLSLWECPKEYVQ